MSFISTWARAGAQTVQAGASGITATLEAPAQSVVAAAPVAERPSGPAREQFPFYPAQSFSPHRIWTPQHSQGTSPPQLTLASGRKLEQDQIHQNHSDIVAAARQEYLAQLEAMSGQSLNTPEGEQAWYKLGASYAQWASLQEDSQQLQILADLDPNRIYFVQRDYAELPPLVRAMVASFSHDPEVRLRIVQVATPEGALAELHLFRELPGGPGLSQSKALSEASSQVAAANSKPLKPFEGLGLHLVQGVAVYLILEESMQLLDIPEAYATPYMLGVPAAGLWTANKMKLTQTSAITLLEGLPLFILGQTVTSLTLDRLSQTSYLEGTAVGSLLAMGQAPNGFLGMLGGISAAHVLPRVAPEFAPLLARAVIPLVALIVADPLVGAVWTEPVTDRMDDASRALGSLRRWTPNTPLNLRVREAVLRDCWFSDEASIMLFPNAMEKLLRLETMLFGGEDVDERLAKARQEGLAAAELQVTFHEHLLLSLALSLPEGFNLDAYERAVRVHYEREDRQFLVGGAALIKLYGDFDSNRAGPVADFYQAIHYNKDGATVSISRHFLTKVLLRAARRSLGESLERREAFFAEYGLDLAWIEQDFNSKQWREYLDTASPEAFAFLFGEVTVEEVLNGSPRKGSSPYLMLRKQILLLNQLIRDLEPLQPDPIPMARIEDPV